MFPWLYKPEPVADESDAINEVESEHADLERINSEDAEEWRRGIRDIISGISPGKLYTFLLTTPFFFNDFHSQEACLPLPRFL